MGRNKTIFLLASYENLKACSDHESQSHTDLHELASMADPAVYNLLYPAIIVANLSKQRSGWIHNAGCVWHGCNFEAFITYNAIHSVLWIPPSHKNAGALPVYL